MSSLLNSVKNLLFLSGMRRQSTPQAFDVDEYIERIIDGIDTKLRLVPGYRKKLKTVVSRSLAHIDKLVDLIPGPIDVSRQTFTKDPNVRAYFATPDTLQETFDHGAELRSYFADTTNREVAECCAMLCANKEERRVLGMEVEGEMVRYDVLQTAINFSDYKVLSPAATDEEVRKGIKLCIFDGMITYALQHIAHLKVRHRDLRNEHRVLHAKLRARQAKGNGLSTMLAEASEMLENSLELQEQFAEVENKLNSLLGKKDIYAFYLDEVRKIFDEPEKFINLNVSSLLLTDMRISVDEKSGQRANKVSFSEIEIVNVMKRVVTIIHFNRGDLTYSGTAAGQF